MRPALLILAAAAIAACAPQQNASTSGRPSARAKRQRPDTVTVRDPELERRAARLELRVLEKEAQVAELESRLADTRDEVVRTMAKLRTLASRAEAASAMAEADVALQTFRGRDGSRALPEMEQATRLMRESTAEFNKENYGGALYLANQAKSVTAAGSARLASGARTPRSGETPFAVPVRLKAAARGNVREGPGTNFPVVFEAGSGESLTAHSYADEWVRVTDDSGRTGWIFRSLIVRP